MDAYGMTCDEWRAWAVDRGLPAFRGQQIFEAIQRGGANDLREIRALPGALRDELSDGLVLTPMEVIAERHSEDGTTKLLLRFADGATAECVGIPEGDRLTVCVSSQAGCAVGCSFCASGAGGLERSLSAGEMVYQVLLHQRLRESQENIETTAPDRKPNVVFMGSGEPLFNYEAVLRCIAVLGEERGLGLGRRRITVSTAGVAEVIPRLADDEPQVSLAISLHAPDDATRDRLVPLNRRWPIAALCAALERYTTTVNRRPTFEYCLLADANMTAEQAEALGRLARRFGALVNLIRYNAVPGGPHRAPSDDEVEGFIAQVEAAGGVVTLRRSRGADIDAACGQLRRSQQHGA